MRYSWRGQNAPGLRDLISIMNELRSEMYNNHRISSTTMFCVVLIYMLSEEGLFPV